LATVLFILFWETISGVYLNPQVLAGPKRKQLLTNVIDCGLLLFKEKEEDLAQTKKQET
jgi:hypothetical protein